MASLPVTSRPRPAPGTADGPSTAGGVVIAARLWGQLGWGRALCRAGIRWQGQGAGTLLAAAVLLPLLGARSIRAAPQCSETARQ